MRTTGNGSLSFGLVNIPVGLAPATKPAARQPDVSFRLLHRECGTPIRQKRFCHTHERDADADKIVKGWEVSKGQFVLVEEAELDLARQVIASLAGEFDPAELRSEYGGNLRALLEAKLAGEELAIPEPVAAEAPSLDLLEALRRSVAEVKSSRAPKATAKTAKASARPKRATTR